MGRIFSRCVLCLGIVLAAGPSTAFSSTTLGYGTTPDIDGSRVVWQRAGEIYLWDGTATTKVVSAVAGSNQVPVLSGSNVVYQRDLSGDQEIYLTSLATSQERPIHSNPYNDTEPDIDGSSVVWTSRFLTNGPDYVFFSGDLGQSSHNVSYSITESAEDPAVSGNNVVWSGLYASSTMRDIFLWNGSDVVNLSSGYATLNGNPDIDGDRVVWTGLDGNDQEIFYWDGTSVLQLTDNDIWDDAPAIDGDLVVWESWDGDPEIFAWDGSAIVQLTDNDVYDQMPAVDGSRVVWRQGLDTFPTIMLLTIPEPATDMLLVLGLGVLWAWARARVHRAPRSPGPSPT